MGLLERIRRRGATPTGGADTTPTADADAGSTQGAATQRPTPADPDTRTHLGTWLDVAADDAADHPTAIEDIYAGRLDGISIRSAFTPEEVAAAVERIRSHGEEFVDHGTTIMFGTALVGSQPDRSDYYAGTATITDRIGTWFDRDFVDRVGGIISAFAGGRPAVVPSEPGRGDYTPATVRFLPPDRGVMHAHTANEFCNVWDAYGHLREIAVMWNSLSYFVVGQAPDGGGNLVLYDLMWDDTPEDVLSLSMSPERDELLERFGTRATDLRAGDMILFTGGRIWHRVEPVVGDRERVTIGGFVALSQDDECVYFWS